MFPRWSPSVLTRAGPKESKASALFQRGTGPALSQAPQPLRPAICACPLSPHCWGCSAHLPWRGSLREGCGESARRTGESRRLRLPLTLLSPSRAVPARLSRAPGRPPGPGAGGARAGRCARRQRHLAAPREGAARPGRHLRRRGALRGRRALPARAPRPCHTTGLPCTTIAVLGLDYASLSFSMKIWNGSFSLAASSVQEQDTGATVAWWTEAVSN